MSLRHEILLRVRYSETDQMGTYYNSRPLEWFECGRSECLRAFGLTYRAMEAEGFRLPVREAHVEYLGKASYDDLLRVISTLSRVGPARFRFDVEVSDAGDGRPICRGWTIHVVTDANGRPTRPPASLVELVGESNRP